MRRRGITVCEAVGGTQSVTSVLAVFHPSHTRPLADVERRKSFLRVKMTDYKDVALAVERGFVGIYPTVCE
jgi:hypothetical protein